MEPFIVVQTAEPMTGEERFAWFREHSEKAAKAGAKWVRHSVNDAEHPTMCLLEAWKERPADEGPQRWSMVPTNDQSVDLSEE